MRPDRRVAFLASDAVWVDPTGCSLPFSYAIRKLDASLRSAPDLGDVETTIIDLRADDPEAFFESIRAFRPSVVAASTYIWSVKLFCEVAERVRRWDPTVRFVMGGPAARPSLLSLAPYQPFLHAIDAVVPGEGEDVIRHIARAHGDADWQQTVPGMRVPGAHGWRQTAAIERPKLDEHVSPYAIGIVPQATIGFLETFRGCPISCAFCQWGEERSDRVYSAEYLAAHLHGLRNAGVQRVYVLDAGFNLSSRAFRNLIKAEQEAQFLRSCQVIGHIYPTYIRDEHLDFFESFGRAEIAIGVQSFDTEVLKRLGRPFDIARFERVLSEMRDRFDIELELILGLPGDNPQSFRRTIERAMDIATSVRVFFCLALPDALLERAGEFQIDFDPETFEVRSCAGWPAGTLQAERDYVCGLAATKFRPMIGSNWVEFFMHEPRPARKIELWNLPNSGSMGALVEDTLVERLRRAVEAAATGWHLAGARHDGEHLLLDLLDVRGARLPLVLEVEPERDGQSRFSQIDGVAYSYRGSLEPGDASRLCQLIDRVHGEVRPVLCRLAEREAGAGSA